MVTDSSSSSTLPPATGSGHRDPLGALPLLTRAVVSFFFMIRNRAFRPDGTVNRVLLNLIDWKSPPTPKPVGGVSSSDFTVEPSRNLWFRLFVPTTTADAGAGSLPLIIFFHGGGFSTLSPASRPYDAFCRRIAGEASAVVASVKYRLTPEHRFPSQYDDGFDALKFIAENSASLLPENVDLTRCFIAGDSAGGNIAHHVAVRAAQGKKIGQAGARWRVRGLIAIQPFFGGSGRTESEIQFQKVGYLSVARADWHWRAFLPEGADRDHWAVNVSGPNGVDISNLEDFPAATLVLVGGTDPLHDWQVQYCEWLKRSGKEAELVEFPDMGHAFYVFPEIPESAQLISKVKDFVARN
ncbi:hypothetical protein SAY86_013933 [Trapa natans]|uniref:Alpha/beta hydrolase fold-3 domain-containing protein n=1 Tax=Trapa natans TaxID=22666 RepID=A0AAN7QQB0_TRANT|nr:hypothetical protein SAY86_013933 [Trapa natans]